MKKLAILIFLTTIAATATWAQTTSCETCHGKLKGRLNTPVVQWQTSVHHDMGINCINCHGGDASAQSMKQAHSRAKGWIGKPGPIQIVHICGNCHANEKFMKQYNPNARTDQLRNYETSNHGINILKKKDGDGATCASCHGAHDVLKASDPKSHVYALNVVDTCARCHADKTLMDKYGIPGDEVANYRKSVHANALFKKRDLFAPTCNDCHGNHGATPPKVTSIVHVCGTCHVQNQTLFNESPHKDWDELGLKQCAECHKYHDIMQPSEDMLSKKDGVCLNCHTEDEPAYTTMTAMHDTITKLKTELENTRKEVDVAADKGMMMDDAIVQLRDARSSLIQTRTAVHKFNKDHVQEVAKAGMTSVENIQKIARQALAEVKNRRTGFYWFLGFFVVLIILLGLKIRSIER